MSRATVHIATEPPYEVHIGAQVLDEVPTAVEGSDAVAVLADERVAALHGSRLGDLASVTRLGLPASETTKSLDRLGEVLEFLAQAGLSRRSTLVTFGGGVIGDLGGLAASLFKRGISVVHCPTTLLAQVDASVGGKTAINLASGKNLAGTFHQPRAVFADTEVLATLPEDERTSGLGEVLKTALIGGPDELATLETQAASLVAGDPAATADVVQACVSVKARVVAEDPLEAGPRRALNLGHTFAHAIEHAAGYGSLPHGVAVAVGITLALQASARLGLLADEGLEARVATLSERLGLPAGLAVLRETRGVELPAEALLAGLAQDKKGRVGSPEFVLPRRAGELELSVVIDEALLGELLA